MFRSVAMTLGDAFNRRKKLAADLQNWINRLGLAGAERRSYRTAVLEGDGAYQPEPGTEKVSTRQYTVQECRERIAAILEEDQELALRISRTNQQARAEIEDLSGRLRVLSIPELLVLKGDTIPKLEQAARAVPLRADDVGVYDSGADWARYRLAADARQVADGDFGHELSQRGPREVRDLGADVDSMRGRILSELSAVQAANTSLEQRSHDLQRSNSELEQFAYVASHDLQEPLRKVASFCQLLQRRYGGQLDEKADQYIEYAVDGAKRMQMLINDLLAFSRVGRVEQARVPVPAADLLAQAEANLATAIRRSRAEVEAGDLPTVLAEPTLLTAVFQNLLSNAIKFRGERAPRVSVTAERDGDFWVFAVADNGIGIGSEYADRIFVIFQRLHDKSTYPGTGIGLAMTRKIIEYHGGRIWLDTAVTSGARFCFTLPVILQALAAGDEPVSESSAVSEEVTAVPDNPDLPAETSASPDAESPAPSGLPEDEETDD